jgi:hypothetical protein
MKTIWFVVPGMICGMAGVSCLAVALRAEPPIGESGRSNSETPAASDLRVDAKDRVSVEVARDRAKVMHDIYAASLEMMHHRYFHRNRAVVPARAMEDVFDVIKGRSNVEAQWIAVNMKAMSIDHVPKSEFAKMAAKEIAAGKPELEAVENGYYRRAGAIPLATGCVGCHGGFFKEPSKTPKFAGLVISVPIINDSDKPK